MVGGLGEWCRVTVSAIRELYSVTAASIGFDGLDGVDEHVCS
jgi:hypothetical protein